MNAILAWETAWAEYINALAAYDADWSGPDFVSTIGRLGRALADAKRALRVIDADFCARLGI